MCIYCARKYLFVQIVLLVCPCAFLHETRSSIPREWMCRLNIQMLASFNGFHRLLWERKLLKLETWTWNFGGHQGLWRERYLMFRIDTCICISFAWAAHAHTHSHTFFGHLHLPVNPIKTLKRLTQPVLSLRTQPSKHIHLPAHAASTKFDKENIHLNCHTEDRPCAVGGCRMKVNTTNTPRDYVRGLLLLTNRWHWRIYH